MPGNGHDRGGEIDSCNALAILPKLRRVVVAATEHQLALLRLEHNRIDVVGVASQHLHLVFVMTTD